MSAISIKHTAAFCPQHFYTVALTPFRPLVWMSAITPLGTFSMAIDISVSLIKWCVRWVTTMQEYIVMMIWKKFRDDIADFLSIFRIQRSYSFIYAFSARGAPHYAHIFPLPCVRFDYLCFAKPLRFSKTHFKGIFKKMTGDDHYIWIYVGRIAAVSLDFLPFHLRCHAWHFRWWAHYVGPRLNNLSASPLENAYFPILRYFRDAGYYLPKHLNGALATHQLLIGPRWCLGHIRIYDSHIRLLVRLGRQRKCILTAEPTGASAAAF